MRIKTLSALSLSVWLECIDISDFPQWIDDFGGVANLMNELMLEKNCPLLTSEGLGKLLSYVESSPQDQNKEAIKSQLNLFMNSTKINQGVFSFFINNSMGLLQLNNNDLANRVDQALINL